MLSFFRIIRHHPLKAQERQTLVSYENLSSFSSHLYFDTVSSWFDLLQFAEWKVF